MLSVQRGGLSCNVRYALACRVATNQDLCFYVRLNLGLGWLRHDKLKHIGHCSHRQAVKLSSHSIDVCEG